MAWRRIPGKYALLGLALAVSVLMATIVIWARSTPSVPDARLRMRGMALPGVAE